MSIEFTAKSKVRAPSGDTRRGITYYFARSNGGHLLVSWAAGAWRCVDWWSGIPARSGDDAESADMREAEAQARAMYEAEHGAPRLQLVA
ncbi:MAG: hypothetical protein PHO64_01655 [Thiomonas sp.]|nr:hypothetical protein [Thiomonas sp.]